MITEGTICAISTAPGQGGIAVIRISGDEAFRICDKIYTPTKAGDTLKTQKAYTLSFGKIHNGTDVLDEVLVAVFRAPQIGRASCRERV